MKLPFGKTEPGGLSPQEVLADVPAALDAVNSKIADQRAQLERVQPKHRAQELKVQTLLVPRWLRPQPDGDRTAAALLADPDAPVDFGVLTVSPGDLAAARALRDAYADSLELGRRQLAREIDAGSELLAAVFRPGNVARTAARCGHLLALAALDLEEIEGEHDRLEAAGVSMACFPSTNTREWIGEPGDFSSPIVRWAVEAAELGLLPAEAIPAGPLRDYVTAKTATTKKGAGR